MGLTHSNQSVVNVDLKVDSAESLDDAIARLEREKKRRNTVNLDLVSYHLSHIRRELEEKETEVRRLSIEHLELFEKYLKRLILPKDCDPKLLKQRDEMLKLIASKLKAHPLASQPRSGDVDGTKHTISVIKVPLGRRRQMAVLMWFNLITGPLLTMIVTFLLWYYLPFSNYLLALYIAWNFIDNRLNKLPNKKRISEKWRHHVIFKHFQDYFPIRHTITGTSHYDTKTPFLDPKRNYLMCYHPHGVQAAGAFAMGNAWSGVDELFPGLSISVQTLRINFSFPFTRENILGLGMGDASKKCLGRALSNKRPGDSAVLVTGGARESLYTQPYDAKVVLKTRKGFVRVAITNGASLVPMWGFGENNLYENLAFGSPRVRRWQRRIQRIISFAPLLVAGRGVFSYSGGLIPHRRPITVVVGKPISTGPPNPNYTEEELNRVHKKYTEAVRALYEKHRDIYDPKASDLEFI